MTAVLLAVLRPEDDDAEDFFTWYEAEHVVGRLAVPGFRDAHRYRATDDPGTGILVYELDALDTLATPQYRKLQSDTEEATRTRMGALSTFIRVTGEVIQEHGEADGPAPLLFVVAFAVPEDEVDDLDAWYAHEHVPTLLQADAWLGVRLVDVADSNTGWTRVAIHRLADVSALEAPERKAAGETEWRKRLGERPWFLASARYTATGVDRFDLATSGR
jgi:hypothetical protein